MSAPACAGFTGQCARAGLDEFAYLGHFMTHHPLQQARSPTDDLPRAAALRCLEIGRDPQGAPAEAVAGAWFTVYYGVLGRESVAPSLLEAGVLEAAVAQLHESSAVEWVNWRSPAGLVAGPIFCLTAGLVALELPGVNKAQLLVDCGMADAIAALLKVQSPRAVISFTIHRSLMIRCWPDRRTS